MEQAKPKSALPPSPYGSPPIYLPFSAVEGPLTQNPMQFVYVTSKGYQWCWYPFAPVVDAGWNQVLQAVTPLQPTPYYELINYQMPSGIQDMIIPFLVEKVSPVILLSGPMIINVVDETPLTGLGFTVTNISTSLLAIQLNALLPAAAQLTEEELTTSNLSNYWFRALATVQG